jgi:hypothetical protein
VTNSVAKPEAAALTIFVIVVLEFQCMQREPDKTAQAIDRSICNTPHAHNVATRRARAGAMVPLRQRLSGGHYLMW